MWCKEIGGEGWADDRTIRMTLAMAKFCAAHFHTDDPQRSVCASSGQQNQLRQPLGSMA